MSGRFNLDAVPAKLLTANPKTAKGEAHGYRTAVLHFAPARISGSNVCPHASPGCVAACLNTAGHGGLGLDADGLNTVQVARIQRVRFWRRDEPGFWAMLERDMAAHLRAAMRDGLKPAVRLNGTSDVPWERVAATIGGERFPNVMRAYPDVAFYDYTKAPPDKRGERGTGKLPKNYSLTFSLSERNERVVPAAFAAGWNVAVVFATPARAPLPERYMDRPVHDGDVHDLRFLDPPGVIVGLRAKGRGKRDQTGFVKQPA